MTRAGAQPGQRHDRPGAGPGATGCPARRRRAARRPPPRPGPARTAAPSPRCSRCARRSGSPGPARARHLRARAPCRSRNRAAAWSAVRLIARRAGRAGRERPLQGELPRVGDHRGAGPRSARQPSSAWIRPEEATSTAGSPGRRGREPRRDSLPVTSRQALSTSQVGEPGAAAQVVDPVLAGRAGAPVRACGPGPGRSRGCSRGRRCRPGSGSRRRDSRTASRRRRERDREDVRDQVGLRVVPLAQPPAVRPGCAPATLK